MNSTKTITMLGIIIILAVMIGLFYWLKTIAPDQSRVEAKALEVKVVEKNLLDSSQVKKIIDRKRYGNVPVKINEGDINKPNPFE